jgi:hypothetical protein
MHRTFAIILAESHGVWDTKNEWVLVCEEESLFHGISRQDGTLNTEKLKIFCCSLTLKELIHKLSTR